jgi:hypothetical protein
MPYHAVKKGERVKIGDKHYYPGDVIPKNTYRKDFLVELGLVEEHPGKPPQAQANQDG